MKEWAGRDVFLKQPKSGKLPREYSKTVKDECGCCLKGKTTWAKKRDSWEGK